MNTKNDKLPIDIGEPYSDNIQSFFCHLKTFPWSSDLNSVVFVRDFSDLPVYSKYDIDIIADKKCQHKLLNYLISASEEFGLAISSKMTVNACFILIIDLDSRSMGRRWAFLEVGDVTKYTSHFSISADSIEIILDPKLGIPVPRRDWQIAISILHSIRNGRLLPNNINSNNISKEITDSVSSIFHKYLQIQNINRCDIFDVNSEFYRDLSRVVLKKNKKTLPSKSMFSYVKSILQKKFYIIPTKNSAVFSLHGPDGVGKTTTCSEVEKIFEGVPLGFDCFHHISGWKRRSEEKNLPPKRKKVSLVREIARFVYRNILPKRWRDFYSLISSYNYYLARLNRRTIESVSRGRLLLIDRYVYDLVAKTTLEGRHNVFIGRIISKLISSPSVSFVLIDDPEKIRCRKQELTLDEIRRYIDMMRVFVPRSRYKEIVVSGKNPQEVAREVSKYILQNCGDNITSYLKSYKNL